MSKLSKEDISLIMETAFDDLTYEKVTDLILHIKEDYPPPEGYNLLERIAWTARTAYIEGFTTAMTLFGIADADELEESV